ncbi:MAG: TonB-dependent receptor [Pseudomonadota bacterium]
MKNIKMKYKPITMAIIVALSLTNISSVFAEEQEPEEAVDKGEDSSKIEEVTVTASRRTETLQDVGMAITSINPEEFDKSGLTSIENLIDYTPGVNFSAAGTPGSGSITMRGASQEAFTPVVGIYLDDVPLSSNTPYASGSALLFDGVLGNIERIEVVKGPQGTLYGATAVGGVIRYVTRDPSTDDFYGSATVDYSSTQHGGTNQTYRANMSGALIEDTLGISISGFSSNTDGFIDRVGSTREEDVNDNNRSGYNMSAMWNISEGSTVKFNVIHSEADWDISPFVSLDFATQAPLFGEYETIETDAFTKLEFDIYSMAYNVDLDWATLTSVSAKSEYDSSTFGDGTATFGGLADLFTGSEPGTNTVPQTQFVSSSKVIQEIRLTSPKSDKFEWLGGFYYSKEDSENAQSAIAQPTNFNLFEVQFPSSYKEKALFGNATWYLSPDFDITLGARYSDTELSLDANFAGLFAAGAPDAQILFNDTIEDQVTTYSLGARWRIEEDMSLYARVASGYRPAVVNIPVFDPATGENVAEPFINSDELWSYEIGIKGQTLEGKLHYDFALWAINWDEFQAAVSVNGINTGGNALAGISANGFEGMLTYFANDSFRIRSTFAYNNSELDADDPTLGALEGEKSRGLPDWTGSLKADYTFDVADWDGAAGFGLRYVGEYNTGYKSGIVGSGGTLNFPVESYQLVDMSASLSNDNYLFTVYITNLLDKYAFANADASDTFSGPITSAVLVPPRTIGASITVRF